MNEREELEPTQGPLIADLYAASTILKKADSDELASLMRGLARLLEEGKVHTISKLEEKIVK